MVQNDIKKFLIRNSIITYAAVAVAFLCIVLMYLTSLKSVDESRKYIYLVSTEGDLVPLIQADRRENIAIEIKHHLTMFINDFYTLNQFNWEANVEKALWLGEFEQHHQKRVNEGYYNRFIQFGYTQEGVLYPENIELRQTANGAIFNIIINLSETVDRRVNKFSIFAKGEIVVTNRNFPHNPHGLFISNYLEELIVRDDGK